MEKYKKKGENRYIMAVTIIDDDNNSEYGYETHKDPFVYGESNETSQRNAVLDDTLVHRTMNANGFFTPGDYDDFDRFYVFPRNDPYKMLGTTREYMFVTKPDLHIFANNTDISQLNPDIEDDPFFKDLMQRGYQYKVLMNLQNSFQDVNHLPFVPMLSNYKVSNLELSPINAGDIESSANMFGTRIFYRKPSDNSDDECDFSVEYKDTKFLDCYLWFKAYDQYEQRKYQGKIRPITNEYVRCKILTDQMTIFKFIVGDDGETLLYWACIWGCYPKTVPRDTFSDLDSNGSLRFTINWHGNFQSDMDPLILHHFNKLVKDYGMYDASIDMPLYDTTIDAIRQTPAFCPYIAGLDTDTKTNTYDSNLKMYKLKWRIKKYGTNTDTSALKKSSNKNEAVGSNEKYNNDDLGAYMAEVKQNLKAVSKSAREKIESAVVDEQTRIENQNMYER